MARLRRPCVERQAIAPGDSVVSVRTLRGRSALAYGKSGIRSLDPIVLERRLIAPAFQRCRMGVRQMGTGIEQLLPIGARDIAPFVDPPLLQLRNHELDERL